MFYTGEIKHFFIAMGGQQFCIIKNAHTRAENYSTGCFRYSSFNQTERSNTAPTAGVAHTGGHR